MADYHVELLHKKDYKTTEWSGGLTTELSIAPEGSVYADRDFMWRLSSATVELEERDFTSLPDYDRIIMTPVSYTHLGECVLRQSTGDVHGYCQLKLYTDSN